MTIQDQYNKWKATILKKSLDKTPERKPRFETTAGIELPRLSLPGEADSAYLDRLGFPGEYPFTRGVQPTMPLSAARAFSSSFLALSFFCPQTLSTPARK